MGLVIFLTLENLVKSITDLLFWYYNKQQNAIAEIQFIVPYSMRVQNYETLGTFGPFITSMHNAIHNIQRHDNIQHIIANIISPG